MNKKIFLLVFVLLFLSCSSKKKTTQKKPRTITVESSHTTSVVKKKERKKINQKADKIIESAMTFSGVRYKFGGTTRKGMDCSGLIYVALQKNGISFPRVSYQMANEGKRIRVGEVQKGDLLFFKTRKNSKRINHVGLVVETKNNEIKFIHSSSSRGVIVSSLREGFWNSAFIKATRIL